VNPTESYLAWAPRESVWSAWAKPVLFGFIGHAPRHFRRAEPPADTVWLPADRLRTALVVDLPGGDAVVLGAVLARQGYRPVPLFNALPFHPRRAARPVVDVESILGHLAEHTPLIAGLRLPPDAPPAFLLDANRRVGAVTLEVGDLDNRSVCFPTDFPSANALKNNGIGRVIVVERSGGPDADLVRVLATWQAEGITLLRKDVARPGAPAPMRLPQPPWWSRLWRALTTPPRRSMLDVYDAKIHAGSG
jgi:hypothetical protein